MLDTSDTKKKANSSMPSWPIKKEATTKAGATHAYCFELTLSARS
jgi:hypothetical protein